MLVATKTGIASDDDCDSDDDADDDDGDDGHDAMDGDGKGVFANPKTS